MKKTLLALLLLASPAAAESLQFQLGYVFDSWSSNFIYSGTEHRMPASLRLTTGDFGLSAEGAFVSGDYQRTEGGGLDAGSFQASQFSDTTLTASWDMKAGPSLVSNLTGSVQFASGDTTWEANSSVAAIPFIFEPSFYHGRGWGGSLFWSIASTDETFNWGAGAGYLLTTTYNIGSVDQGTFNPGDSLVAMGGMGGRLSPTGTIGMQVFHTFAFESKVTDPLSQFTSAESTVFTGQWLEKMGGDKFSLNASYSFYGRGWVADPVTGDQVREDENFLGDRLELRPFLGWAAGPGVSMMTGLVWDRIFPNGYDATVPLYYQAGGDLFGVEQGVTFSMGGGTFLNLVGLYHLVINEKAATDQVTGSLYDVAYHRVSFGTNVGFQW
ncbi:MAG TPA: hypothetical protein VHE12_00180 [bacterium]|nr:hypothetical protein [bacterium]